MVDEAWGSPRFRNEAHGSLLLLFSYCCLGNYVQCLFRCNVVHCAWRVQCDRRMGIVTFCDNKSYNFLIRSTMCMCADVCVCVCARACACVCGCVRVCVCVCASACMCAHVVAVLVRVCMFVFVSGSLSSCGWTVGHRRYGLTVVTTTGMPPSSHHKHEHTKGKMGVAASSFAEAMAQAELRDDATPTSAVTQIWRQPPFPPGPPPRFIPLGNADWSDPSSFVAKGTDHVLKSSAACEQLCAATSGCNVGA
jgi:hypothetical protein